MNNKLGCLMLATTLIAPLAAQAEAQPLAREELARCASQVQALRQDSARLIQKNAQLDIRREPIRRTAAGLESDRAALDPDDLKASLALRERSKQHNADAAAFNVDIEQIKGEISSLNQVKREYDRNCSNRPYKRRDLEALAPEAQAAMRAGLDDVQVPYID